MNDFFSYATPGIYALLVLIWVYIFIFYTKKISIRNKNEKLLNLLLIILAIDAFRSFFESVYFGAWYASYAGIIPIKIFNFLSQPDIVFFPKIFNLVVAILVLILIIRKWLPADLVQKEATQKLIDDQSLHNKQLLAAVEQSANTIVITSVLGSIEYTNPKFTEVTGYTAKEALGKNPRILSSGLQAKEYYAEMWKTISLGEVWKGEFQNKHKNGTLFWEQVTISPIKNDKGEIINYLAVKEDISALKESEERLKTLINELPDIILFIDGEGKWKEVNQAGLDLFGLTASNYRGKKDKELHGLSNINQKALISCEFSNNTVWEQKRTMYFEEVLPTPQGDTIIFDVTKVPIFNSDNSRKGLLIIKKDITNKKAAERIIVEQKLLYETIFNSITDGIVMTNTEREIILVNKGMQTTFGYGIKDLIGKKTNILYANDKLYSNVGQNYYTKQVSTNTELFITNYKKKDNSIFPGETFGTKLLDTKGEWIGNLGIMRNIKNRIQSQNNLLQSANMIASSSDMIALVDNNFTYLLVNKCFTKTVGLTNNQIIGKKISNILGEDNFINIIKPNALKCLNKGVHVNYKEWINMQSRGILYLDINYYPYYNEAKDIIGFVINARDITLSKNNEIALIEAKEKSEESENILLQSQAVAKLGHYVLKVKTGQWTNSEELNNIFGIDASLERNLDTWLAMVHPDSQIEMKDYIFNHVINNKNDFDKQYKIINKKTKEELWVHGLGSLKYDSNNEPIEMFGTIQDVTLQKMIEQQLFEAKEKAEESNKLKTEFLNNMSHEIRTPMNGILGFSDMLNNEGLTKEKQSNYVKIIQSSSKQLLNVIDDILEISRLGTKQVKVIETDVCLNDVLLELFSTFDLKAKEQKNPLYLKKALSDRQSTIITDKTKLIKVLSNLLENALKFTNEGFIEFGYRLKKDSIELYVKDTGIGIERSKHESIFERFSQAEKDLSKNVGGLGLGLSIAKENAELLGGSIQLESIEGKGATFFVTIPYKRVYKDTKESKTEPNYTILIAEDEEINFLYVETLLKDVIGVDCKIIHVTNGKDAIETCKENKTIDLVLMDLKMPILNGFEATKLIKQQHPNLPIIAQTAYSTLQDKEQAVTVGCDDFISKPIHQESFKNILDKYLIIK